MNTDLDVADASKLDFFYWLFTPEMFCYNSLTNQTVCSHNDRSSTQPALQEVNKRPCRAQQRATWNCKQQSAASTGSKTSAASQLLISSIPCSLKYLVIVHYLMTAHDPLLAQKLMYGKAPCKRQSPNS